MYTFLSRCGSVVLDFMMRFDQSVVLSHVVTSLSDAAREDRFGDFKVDPDSIRQVLTSKGTCYKETVSDQIKKGRVTPCFALVFRQSKCTFFRLQAMSLEQYFCQD